MSVLRKKAKANAKGLVYGMKMARKKGGEDKSIGCLPRHLRYCLAGHTCFRRDFDWLLPKDEAEEEGRLVHRKRAGSWGGKLLSGVMRDRDNSLPSWPGQNIRRFDCSAARRRRESRCSSGRKLPSLPASRWGTLGQSFGCQRKVDLRLRMGNIPVGRCCKNCCRSGWCCRLRFGYPARWGVCDADGSWREMRKLG